MLGTNRLFLVTSCLAAFMAAVSEAVVYCDYSGEKRNKIVQPVTPKYQQPQVTKTEWEYAAKKAHEKVVGIHTLEHDLYEHKVVLSPKCPAYKNSVFKTASSSCLKKADQAEEALSAALYIAEEKHLTKDDRKYGFDNVSLSNAVYGESCFEEPSCDADAKYRTIDGSCNNLQNPKWGQAERAFRRILVPDYADGLYYPRRASDGDQLPSARVVSSTATVTGYAPKPEYTHMLMQWGQFLDHDITHTPAYTAPERFSLTCCPSEANQYSVKPHPACFPISIPKDDPFYKQYGVTCMEFVRSLPAERTSCTYGPREQVNQITAYIDASNVYGSDKKRADSLRTFSGGELKSAGPAYRSILPPDVGNKACEGEPKACFKAGDRRANEQPNLAIMHTIWMRQHNKIARELKALNPVRTDEKIYKEARRIIGAQMQHITYNEWLPIILGRAFMRKNRLLPQKTGYSNLYDSSVDATIANAFATAAYRFGHSLIYTKFEKYSYDRQKEGYLELRDFAFKPSFLYEEGTMDPLILGLTMQKPQRFDNVFATDLKNKLFANGESYGLDLVSLNVQRGRDHGLPSYVEFRASCGLGRAKTFDDLREDISAENIQKLKATYRSVDDIDLFIGGVSETPKRGALVGLTFRCIIGDQFQRLKFGDRYFYEYGFANETRFTPRKLEEIKKTTLARIICDNGHHIEKIQPRVFQKTSKYVNQIVPCDDFEKIPALDINQWIHY